MKYFSYNAFRLMHLKFLFQVKCQSEKNSCVRLQINYEWIPTKNVFSIFLKHKILYKINDLNTSFLNKKIRTWKKIHSQQNDKKSL